MSETGTSIVWAGYARLGSEQCAAPAWSALTQPGLRMVASRSRVFEWAFGQVVITHRARFARTTPEVPRLDTGHTERKVEISVRTGSARWREIANGNCATAVTVDARHHDVAQDQIRMAGPPGSRAPVPPFFRLAYPDSRLRATRRRCRGAGPDFVLAKHRISGASSIRPPSRLGNDPACRSARGWNPRISCHNGTRAPALCGGSCARGSHSVKTEPRPGKVSMPTSPPCRRARSRASARPSPVPGPPSLPSPR